MDVFVRFRLPECILTFCFRFWFYWWLIDDHLYMTVHDTLSWSLFSYWLNKIGRKTRTQRTGFWLLLTRRKKRRRISKAVVHCGPAAPAALPLCCLARPASGWQPITVQGSYGTLVQCVRVKERKEGEEREMTRKWEEGAREKNSWGRGRREEEVGKGGKGRHPCLSIPSHTVWPFLETLQLKHTRNARKLPLSSNISSWHTFIVFLIQFNHVEESFWKCWSE